MISLYFSAILSMILNLSGVFLPSDIHQTKSNCNDFEVFIKSQKNGETYLVEFNIGGGTEPYRFIFYEASGKLLSDDFNKSKFKSVPKGTYQVTAIDQKNCRKTKSFDLP